ncbi:hypothetical protein MMPV_002911 [Pyropia vietnamensis]
MQCVTISLAAPPGTIAIASTPLPPPDAAAFADALSEAGALAVSLTPPSTLPTTEASPLSSTGTAAAAPVAEVAPIYHEVPPGAVTWASPPRVVWPAATIEAIFDAGVNVTDVLHRLAASEGLPAPPRYVIRPVDTERDWVAEVQAGFPPVRVGRLLIRYPWHGPGARKGGNREVEEEQKMAESEGEGTVVLPIEPGCAFGTGEHPTTRLVLRYLQTPAAAVAGARVLDYGCGSGVLALAAAALGATTVVGVDIDPDAVAVAAANAAGGGVSIVVAAAYDVIVANILAAPLIALAPGLRLRAVRGGRLALAGLLAEQAPAVREAYEAAGWDVTTAEVIDGWVLLAGVAR